MPSCSQLRLLPLLLLLGCPTTPTGDPNQPPRLAKHYGARSGGLRALWQDILTACQRDERQRVHLLMASMVMTDRDLAALFGETRARQLGPRYSAMIARVVNAGAMELVATVAEKKYDEVEVFPLDAQASPENRAIIAALPDGTEIFGVRLKRKGQTLGLRYDFFVFRDQRWTTGNQLGRYLVELPPPAEPSRGGGDRPVDSGGSVAVGG